LFWGPDPKRTTRQLCPPDNAENDEKDGFGALANVVKLSPTGKALYAGARHFGSSKPAPVAATEKDRTKMGRFDSRNSEKMTRRKGQQKKKERLARRAEATKAARKATKPTKKGSKG